MLQKNIKKLHIPSENISEADELRLRLIKAKSNLPKRMDFNLYEFMFGKLSEKEKNRINNVWLFKITDKQITKNFEILAKSNKAVK